MTKRITLNLIWAFMALVVMATTATSMDKAAEAYNKELYNQALNAYLQQEKTGEVSADLYYNIANTYYRLKDNPHAILYYERALLLDPGNTDARFNLDFVRSRSQINEESGANILSIWIENLVSSLSSNAWAVIALLAFLLTLAAVLAYVFLDAVLWRKVGFFGSIIALVVSVLSIWAAMHMHTRAVSHNEAIVMASPAVLSTSPRIPKDKTEVAFELAQGFKVTIIDRVETVGKVWYHVETASHQQAWINANDIEVI